VKVRGSVQRELDEGTSAGETFTLFARLATPEAAAQSKSTGKGPTSAARLQPKARSQRGDF
jgi:hypothetical protein